MRANHAQDGRVEWIGLRPERLKTVDAVLRAEIADTGLLGDHGRAGKRAVTLIQAEHLPVIAKLSNLKQVLPEHLRRNLVISKINLQALRHTPLRVGSAVVQIEGPCPPCSRMEKTLGFGVYNAMRGHGGWYASVVEPGIVAVGDVVKPVNEA